MARSLALWWRKGTLNVMSSAQVFAQLTVNGIAVGAIYALVALGLVLTYKATEVLNFAQGDLLALSAFIAWGLIAVAGFSFWWALLATVLISAVLAYGIDAVVIRRIAGQPQFAGIGPEPNRAIGALDRQGANSGRSGNIYPGSCVS